MRRGRCWGHNAVAAWIKRSAKPCSPKRSKNPSTRLLIANACGTRAVPSFSISKNTSLP
ncbi:hypothetical protein D3C81_2126920 [compost metagenome]